MPKSDRPQRMVPCPYCGEEIRSDARACPHCGSDENTGWSDDRYLDGTELPDSEEYGRILENEFPAHTKRESPKVSWLPIAGAAVLIATLIGLLRMIG